MFRKSIALAAVAVTLAAGSAFAADHVTGKVTKVDVANGDIWLDNGLKFDVGTQVASGVLPGNTLSIIYTDYNGNVDVQAVSTAS